VACVVATVVVVSSVVDVITTSKYTKLEDQINANSLWNGTMLLIDYAGSCQRKDLDYA